MPRDYDTQLIESVAVRRRRMRDALLFGANRSRRTLDENLGKLFAGLAIAGVLCAGSVGWSFLQHQMALQRQQQNNFPTSVPTQPTASPVPTASVVPTTGGYGTPEPTETVTHTRHRRRARHQHGTTRAQSPGKPTG